MNNISIGVLDPDFSVTLAFRRESEDKAVVAGTVTVDGEVAAFVNAVPTLRRVAANKKIAPKDPRSS